MIEGGRDIIRAGYAAGTRVAEIARQCGSTPGSVKVIAHKMGLRHTKPFRRRVPPFAGYDRHELRWGGRTVTGGLSR